MKKLFLPIVVLTIATLSSCGFGSGKNSSETDSVKFVNNCENPEWFNEKTLAAEVAKSGKFSSKLDENNEFSYGLSVNGEKLNGNLKIKGEVWCNLVDSSANPSVVIQGHDSTGKSICWQSFGLEEKVKAVKNWKALKFDFKLPETFKKSDVLKIYVWNAEKKKMYIDDWKIVFTK